MDSIEAIEGLKEHEIAKKNGETIDAASTYKTTIVYIHTEEATGSIPVSPTTPSLLGGSLMLDEAIRERLRFDFSPS